MKNRITKVQPSSVSKGIAKPLVSGIPNRSIKFRGQRVDNGEWVYGYYAKHQINYGIYVKSETGFLEWVQVEDNSVGQFTGEYTDNGVEIYDGDIFKPFSEGILFYVVRFEKGAFVLHHNYGYWGTLARFSEVTEKMKVDRIIIGNVRQNPELLG